MAGPAFDQAALAPYVRQALMAKLTPQQAVASSEPPQGTKAPLAGWEKALRAGWVGSAAADAATTQLALQRGGFTEGNPALAWAGKKGVVPLAVGLDALTYYLGDKYLRPNHPKLLDALLGAGMGAHGWAAAHNAGQLANGRASAGPPASAAPPWPGAVRCSDGSWVNPEYATCR